MDTTENHEATTDTRAELQQVNERTLTRRQRRWIQRQVKKYHAQQRSA